MKAGWRIKKLGDISKINYGYTEKASFEIDGPKFLRITDIQDNVVNWEKVPSCKITKNDFEKFRLNDGDIVFARTGATTGKSYLVRNPKESVFASYLIKLSINERVATPDFLQFFFQTKGYWDRITSGISGSAQGGFNASKLAELDIPIPPLPEQRRIVAILDEAFADIAAAKEKAEQNLKNAKEVFENHLQFIFTRCSKDWKKTTLEKVLDIQPQNGWSPPSENHADCGTPVLTLSSVTGFIFKPDKIKFTSADTNLSKRYWVKNGDFLMTRSNTPELVGHVAIAHGIEKPTIYPDLIMRMIPNQEYMVNEFLYYQMRSPVLRDEITGRAQGANPTMKKISNKSAKTIPIFAPSVKIQKKIVEEVKSLSAETSLLESLYQQKLSNLEELKKSLLQQAFSGAL